MALQHLDEIANKKIALIGLNEHSLRVIVYKSWLDHNMSNIFHVEHKDLSKMDYNFSIFRIYQNMFIKKIMMLVSYIIDIIERDCGGKRG